MPESAQVSKQAWPPSVVLSQVQRRSLVAGQFGAVVGSQPRREQIPLPKLFGRMHLVQVESPNSHADPSG